MNTNDYYNKLTYNTDRGPSPSIWHDCRTRDYREDPGKGFVIGSDFIVVPSYTSSSGADVVGSFGDWALFISQGGGITNPTGGQLGGAITIASDGDDEGVVLGSKIGSALIATRGGSGLNKCWFEARIKVSTIADTKADVFVGLVEGFTPSAILPITASIGTLADLNLIGFHRIGSDGDQIDFVYKADGQAVQYVTGLTDMISTTNSAASALAADTYVKLGFVYDRNKPAANRIAVYVNGYEMPTYVTETMIAAATFPSDMALSLALAIINNAGSSPCTATCDWLWLGGEYAS